MADDKNPQLPLTPPPGDGGPGGPGALNIVPVNIEEEMRRSYLDYSMSVIIGRALPDVRDGLKPVHRRVLYTMNEMGLQHNKKYTKCAKVVGQAMGQYHPHGDSAIYDTLVRLAQDFSLRYPLVDGQGNFGSVDGDPPAAMRYTEARMALIADEMLAEIEKDTVDFQDNYDGRLREPLTLPARLPNLLINGSSGIAVGMATNIPPHNLNEICDAVIRLIDNPEMSADELCEVVHGPDFPTGGTIFRFEDVKNTVTGEKERQDAIRHMYATGRGRVIIRGQVTLGLKRMLEHYIAYRREVIRRRTEFDLSRAQERAHILEGLKIALDNLDEVIATIRAAADVDTARSALMKRFELSEAQANAILEMQLRRLAALERKKIEDEYESVIRLIAELEDLLANPRKMLIVIKDELGELKRKYGDERKTRIQADANRELTDEDLIAAEDVVVTLPP